MNPPDNGRTLGKAIYAVSFAVMALFWSLVLSGGCHGCNALGAPAPLARSVRPRPDRFPVGVWERPDGTVRIEFRSDGRYTERYHDTFYVGEWSWSFDGTGSGGPEPGRVLVKVRIRMVKPVEYPTYTVYFGRDGDDPAALRMHGYVGGLRRVYTRR